LAAAVSAQNAISAIWDRPLGPLSWAFFFAQASTDFHSFFLKYLLPTFRDVLIMRIRLIEKKNFSSQFKEAARVKPGQPQTN